MPKYTHLEEAISDNTQAFCDTPECFSHRTGFSRYCSKHRSIHQRLGHPQQRTISNVLHEAERDHVRSILKANQDHPGIASAIGWIDGWTQDAILGTKGTLAPADMRRLSDFGITSLDILVAAAGFYLYEQANRHKFMNADAVDIAMSRSILGLAPRYKTTRYAPSGAVTRVPVSLTSAALRKVGKHVRTRLIPLFVNLQVTIERNRAAAAKNSEAMRAPLAYPTVLVQAEQPLGPPW